MTKLVAMWVVLLGGCLLDSGDDNGGPPGPYCGDGSVDPGEQCDDGNLVSGDGCSACVRDAGQGDVYIHVSWQLKNLSTNTVTTCPTGYDTAAVYSQPSDAAGNPIGSPIIDLFDCSTGTGTTAPLPPDLYTAWVQIADHNNIMTYARSLAAFLDLTTSDRNLSVQLLNDGGYFKLAWNLVRQSNNATIDCATAGASGGIEAVATDVSNASNSASDLYSCGNGKGVTAGYLASTYTVSIAALNASMQSLGTSAPLANKVIMPRNTVTELGTVTIPITGL